MSRRVLCLRPQADFVRVNATAPESLNVSYLGAGDSQLPAIMKASEALVIPAVGPKLAPELFEGTPLRLVQVTGAGVDRLDRAALARLRIPVANVPGGSNSAVAEYALTAASILLRRFACADAQIKSGNYTEYRARMIADNLAGVEGLLVGLVGFGTIGRAVAKAFGATGARVCFFDPAPIDPDISEPLHARFVPFDELLSSCDVISLHVPLVPATRNMIGAAQLARMKHGAILIQASRGGVVDEAALAACLCSGRLGGAAIDVYSTEPPTSDNPLLKLSGEAASRLLLTPHIAGVTRQASVLLFRSAWANVERTLVHGLPPQNRVY